MRNQTTTVALFTSLTTGVAFLLLAGHLGGPVPLSSEEVRADGQRLAGLAARTRIETPGTQRVVQITYTLGDDCGSYQGLALLSDWRPNGALAEPETQLGFTVELGARHLQRNPARPPLPFLALHRDPMSTDLVPAGHPRRFFVTVTSPPEGSGAEVPVSLRLGNVEGRPDLAAASALSWGLGALVRPVDCRLGPEDHRVLVGPRPPGRGLLHPPTPARSTARQRQRLRREPGLRAGAEPAIVTVDLESLLAGTKW